MNLGKCRKDNIISSYISCWFEMKEISADSNDVVYK